ncbi:hypothetical protein [Streptomyces werraensis]|uniref:hypothetical protein n=1 Tax=Streptomyces werraensis TaxID=68284 RepID=UPI0036F56DF7
MAVTKWDLINDDERAYLERTPFKHTCSGCGEMLSTEADFAKHFFVPDSKYPNSGWCPVKEGLI